MKKYIFLILFLLILIGGLIFSNIKQIKIIETKEQKILQQEQTIRDYQAKEQLKQNQYQACLKKCDSAFPNLIKELKEINDIYLQTCKLECKENYGM